MKIIIPLLILIITSSCSMVKGAYYSAKGAECYDVGDYDNSIMYLEKSNEIDNRFGFHHTDLAKAYMAKGEFEKAWVEMRKAAVAPYRDTSDELIFYLFYEIYVFNRGVDKVGNSRFFIETQIGKPDPFVSKENYSFYGPMLFVYEEEKLVEVRDMLGGLQRYLGFPVTLISNY